MVAKPKSHSVESSALIPRPPLLNSSIGTSPPFTFPSVSKTRLKVVVRSSKGAGIFFTSPYNLKASSSSSSSTPASVMVRISGIRSKSSDTVMPPSKSPSV